MSYHAHNLFPILLLTPFPFLAQGETVVESSRAFPLVRETDVLVVGGTSGAVAAAVEAKQQGAEVFLIAPRPYLGEDIAGTLRMWLEPDEKPESELGKALFLDTDAGIPFTYRSEPEAGGRHPDPNRTLLNDGRFEDVQHHSAEYQAEKTKITLDLKGSHPVTTVEAVSYIREGDFDIARAHLAYSVNGKQWPETIPLTAVPGSAPDQRIWRATINREVRAIALAFFKKEGCSRILLGEIRCLTDTSQPRLRAPRPLGFKQVLDQTLLTNNVPFLTGCYVTDLLKDETGAAAGVIVANRSGRQAIRAKCLIDATERATVARMAGARFAPYPAGEQTFTRIIIAGEAPEADDMTVRQLPGDFDAPITHSDKGAPRSVSGKAWLCTLRLPMRNGSFASFAEAEQRARDKTFVTSQLEVADTLFQVPPDPVVGVKNGPEALRPFLPDGIAHLALLGGCADMPRPDAARLLRPLALIDAGRRVGQWAAADAAKRPSFRQIRRIGTQTVKDPPADAPHICELLQGLRPYDSGLPTVQADACNLPVLDHYDVVVIGGGTGGAPAAIGAGRQGAKTLLVEYLYGLGGVGTLGMIGKYWYGNICGFTAEHDRGVTDLGAAVHVIGKREWWRRENRKAGTEIWFGAMGCGTVVRENRVIGAVIATPFGRGVVLAGNVIDATGNADLAAASGAPCVFQSAEEIAVQGAGLSPRKLGASYINSDWGYVNDGDAVDQWLFGVRGRAGAGSAWDISQLTESRERRRVVGAVTVSPLDVVNERTFPDTIVQGRSDFDSHGYSVDDICYISEINGKRIYGINVPYRAILPKTLDGLAVIGLGASAHRDAMPLMRMQPDIQNMGYAAGVAGAMSSRLGKTFRELDVRQLQKHLVEKGNLPREVLNWKDNTLYSPEQLADAVKALGDGYKGIGRILAQREEALPLIRSAYTATDSLSRKVVYAHVLGILGDATGAETLIRQFTGEDPVIRINLKGLAAFGRRMDERDSLLVALGRTRDARALPILLAEAAKIDAKTPFNHVRALTLALEAQAAPQAAPILSAVLAKPGIGGHARPGHGIISPRGGFGDNREQQECLRELGLARVLYRSGDPDGLARKILEDYAQDIRGIYALHARAVLQTDHPAAQSKIRR